jgi:hypothetical protein
MAGRPVRGAAPKITRGAPAIAEQALIGALPGAELHPALVNGAAGVVVTVRGRPFAIMGFTVRPCCETSPSNHRSYGRSGVRAHSEPPFSAQSHV